MSSRRAERIASVIHAELARLLREEVKDPRIGTISITGVSVRPDLSIARVRYLPLAGEGDRALVQSGLDAAARFLRGPIGRALGIRHAPELRFELDPNIEYAAHMDALLRNLPAPVAEAAVDAGDADAGDADAGDGDAVDHDAGADTRASAEPQGTKEGE